MPSAARTRIRSSSAGWAAITPPTTFTATKKSTPEPIAFEAPVAGGAIAGESLGAGAPLLLLHGWALDRSAWAPQRVLAGRFRLILPDRRGFGRSTAPPDVAAETADLLAICDMLGIGRAVLVGMSQGGRVALQFALAHPDRVAGLILQGTPLSDFLPARRGEDHVPIDAYRELVREGRIAEMKRDWGGHALMRGVDSARLLAGYDGRDLLVPAGPAAALAGSLGEIDAPALVVTGSSETPWLDLVGDALAYGLPNARRARVPGGHLCNWSHPKPYNEMAAGFAAEIGA
jgi:pimeloyl-ACP methyl ester carboxylesterase